ncbi:ribonuclease P protein component [Thiotrichales bacterium 19S3-7]|nr:ribonuclease P protein component [Thiotrichales bacterium 19S3-7]MCF6801655.1 ribonuclease P protein component [Thiotrichales bacterium 19S3-11]
MLPKIYRFSKKDFSIVFNSSTTKRVSTRFFTLLLTKDQTLVAPRLGVILAKKKQKKAVERNYTKRIIHACFYNYRNQLNGSRLVVLSNRDIKNANRVDLWEDLEKLFKKVSY